MDAFSDTNLSMLDLITNVLAAVLILFFIMSAFQLPPPAPRVCDTMMIDVELDDREARAGLWLQPAGSNVPEHRLLNDEIPDSGNLQAGHCHEELAQLAEREEEFLIPTVMLYRGATPNRRVAIVRSPTVGRWHAGVLYQEHPRIAEAEQPVSATIKVWHRSQAEGHVGLAGQATIDGSTGAAVAPLDIKDRQEGGNS